MELLDVIEMFVKYPLLNTSFLDDSKLDKVFVESYKNSNTHKIRELLAKKKEFSDMSHVIPFSDMSHVFPAVK
ncbi:TPA: hypothetical protein I8672_002629 [Legionella pneumophila]|nr:hypothetical protein [Legionella pneumophila]HBD7283638.1 hypothetical protein [Legionella pneumophila]HEN8241157.1 hypothetical protein [Legionella pneumophila]